jgi:hypothetical protein
VHSWQAATTFERPGWAGQRVDLSSDGHPRSAKLSQRLLDVNDRHRRRGWRKAEQCRRSCARRGTWRLPQVCGGRSRLARSWRNGRPSCTWTRRTSCTALKAPPRGIEMARRSMPGTGCPFPATGSCIRRRSRPQNCAASILRCASSWSRGDAACRSRPAGSRARCGPRSCRRSSRIGSRRCAVLPEGSSRCSTATSQASTLLLVGARCTGRCCPQRSARARRVGRRVRNHAQSRSKCPDDRRALGRDRVPIHDARRSGAQARRRPRTTRLAHRPESPASGKERRLTAPVLPVWRVPRIRGQDDVPVEVERLRSGLLEF